MFTDRQGAFHKCSDVDLLLPVMEKQGTHQRMPAFMILGHKQFDFRPRIQSQDTINGLNKHVVHINLNMHPLYILK